MTKELVKAFWIAVAFYVVIKPKLIEALWVTFAAVVMLAIMAAESLLDLAMQ